MTAPIIVPDDDSTAEVIRDAILRAGREDEVVADEPEAVRRCKHGKAY